MNSLLRAAPAWITGYGVTTSVGGNTAQSCASMRAGTVRFVKSDRYACAARDPENEPPEEALIVPVAEIDPEARGVDRLVLLSIGALTEAIESARITRNELTGYVLALALPQSGRPGATEFATRFAAELLRRSSLPQPKQIAVSQVGHSGVGELLASVPASLAEHSMVLLLAVDSLLDRDTLGWLDGADRLKCTRAPEGVLAGEAAAAFLLETPRGAERASRKPLATLDAVGLAVEEAHLRSDRACVGVGLSAAVRAANGALAKSPSPPWVVLDHNGERYRALEWAYVVTRLHAIFREVDPTWYVADSVGDVGAAVGGLATARVLAAYERGYAPAEQAWVLLGSDDGARAAFVLGSPKRGA